MIIMTDNGLLIACLVISFLSLICSFAGIALWIGQRLSTHKIEWRTIKMDDAQDAQTLSKKLNEPYEEEEFDLI